MAINQHIKTGYDARVAGKELINAAEQLALGVLMGMGQDPMALVYSINQVGEDYLKWAEGVADTDEVFIPAEMVAQLDQTHAVVRDFLND